MTVSSDHDEPVFWQYDVITSILLKEKNLFMSVERTPCSACGAYTISEKHHIAPLEYGGLDSPDNIVYLCRTCHDLVTRGFSHIGNVHLIAKTLVATGGEAVKEAKLFSLLLGKMMALWVVQPLLAHKMSIKFMGYLLDPSKGSLRNSFRAATLMNEALYGYKYKNRRLVEIPSEKRVIEKLNELRKRGVGSETILKSLEKLGH